MTERMGYWVDTDQAYWTMNAEYVDSLWWALQQIHRARPAGAGPPRRSLLPALWHWVVRPRAGPGIRRRRRPVGVRPAAHRRGPLADLGESRGSSSDLDHDPVDAGVQHRGGGAPRRDLRGGSHARTASSGRRRTAWPQPSSARTIRDRLARSQGATWSGRATRRPSTWSPFRARRISRSHRAPGRVRHRHRRHRPRSPCTCFRSR